MKKLPAALLVLLLGACTSAPPPKATLHDRLGGTYAIAAVCHDFLGRLLTNPVIGANPAVAAAGDPARVPGLWFQLTAQVVDATGGPVKYKGRGMKDVHHGMNITDREWDAMAADFKATLDHFKVPAAEQAELFAIVGTTRKDIVTAPVTEKPTRPKEPGDSLYARLGGAYAIAAVCDDFLKRLLKNSVINANPKVAAAVRPERGPGLLFLLIVQVIEVAGGPYAYSGKSMKEAHKGMDITGAEWDAMAADFKATLDHFKVPAREQEELFKGVGATRADIVTKP
jgi:hemoglobin